MVRNYNRTTNRQSWEQTQMAKAIEAHNAGTPLLTAAKMYNIPRNTLRRHVELYKAECGNMELTCLKGLGRFEPVFSPLQEAELAAFLKKQEEVLHGLTRKECRILAWQIAEKNGLAHNFREGMAERDWLRLFLKRQSTLSIRVPEGVSPNRAMAFNKIVVQTYFALLSEQLEKYDFSPDRIFNVDETGASVIPKTLSKIVATKGKRQVGKKTSGERGKTVTVIVCASASGTALPPVFIFPRKRMNPKLMEGAIDGAWGMATESGWSTMESFYEWFKWYVDVVKPTEDKPTLLLLDGHCSHVKNLEVIQYARAHHTVILCFPPHYTHKLQPLDVIVMKPISVYYDDEVSEKERRDTGRNTLQSDIPHLFGRAFTKATRPSVIKNGFRATGIYPFNSQVFKDADFAPSEVTNRPPPHAQTSGESEEMTPSTSGDIPEEETASPFPYLSSASDSEQDVAVMEQAKCDLEPQLNRSTSRACKRLSVNIEVDSDDDDESAHSQVQQKATNSKYRKLYEKEATPFIVKPQDIMPIPLANDNPTRKRRTRGKTMVVTGDEYLAELAEAKERVREKETRKIAQERKKALKTLGLSKPQGKLKRKKRDIDAQIESEDEDEASDEEDDATCGICGGLYSESNEVWIQCDKCNTWTHILCVGISEDDCEDDYICSSCEERPKPTTRSTRSSNTSRKVLEMLERERDVSEDLEKTEDVGIMEINEDIDDVPCMFSNQRYSVSTSEWIQCDKCDLWAHMQCAGVLPENSADDYICKTCKRSRR